MPQNTPVYYPEPLALAYLFLVSYCVSRLFLSVRLPSAVGIIFVGIAFSYFLNVEIAIARDALQELAFFLVLLKAGFEISVRDLDWASVFLSCGPAFVEVAFIALAAAYSPALQFSFLEAVVLGLSLAPIGDGLVIPKMVEFSKDFPDHALPRLLFIWAPVEASFILMLYGIFAGLSSVADAGPGLIVGANVLNLLCTLTLGTLAGYLAAVAIPKRTALASPYFGVQIFTGLPIESFLLVVSLGLCMLALGNEGIGEVPTHRGLSDTPEATGCFVPIPFAPEVCAFSAELLVMATASAFATFVCFSTLHEVEDALAAVWVFGQLILFSMLGSKTKWSDFSVITRLWPCVLIGLSGRALGVIGGMLATYEARPCPIAPSPHPPVALPSPSRCPPVTPSPPVRAPANSNVRRSTPASLHPQGAVAWTLLSRMPQVPRGQHARVATRRDLLLPGHAPARDNPRSSCRSP